MNYDQVMNELEKLHKILSEIDLIKKETREKIDLILQLQKETSLYQLAHVCKQINNENNNENSLSKNRIRININYPQFTFIKRENKIDIQIEIWNQDDIYRFESFMNQLG